MKEKKISGEGENYLKLKSQQSEKPSKILGTILELNERRTATNVPENKKTNDNA